MKSVIFHRGLESHEHVVTAAQPTAFLRCRTIRLTTNVDVRVGVSSDQIEKIRKTPA